MKSRKIVVVGAGPGGLTAAMILARHGYEVEVFEKQPVVGGRNASLELGGYTFDLGPTFLMMTYILEDVFALAGRDLASCLEMRSLDPLYRLVFGDGTPFFPTRDRAAMVEQIERLFPGSGRGYERYLAREKEKFARIKPCLQVPYGRLADYATMRILRAMPYLDLHRNLFPYLGRYFDDDRLKLSFTFQAKYLGMSPWRCPALFSIISYIEHEGGVHHPIGGLNRISKAMAQIVEEHGGRIHLARGVRRIVVRGGRAVGVELEEGGEVLADDVVLNADFGHAMTHLVPREALRRWTPERLERKSFSCSTFMLYLGVKKRYDVPHHNIVFSPDYKRNVTEIAEELKLSEEPSFYIQNACATDPGLAPEGKSTIYVLVPVPNNRSGIDWEREKDRYRDKVLDLCERRGGLTGLRQNIEEERVITPRDWEEKAFVYRGATFNLGHGIDQMLYFRPHNQFEEIDRLFLVGGGTHPGSGLPTIVESGRISADLILSRDARTS
jgi:phytoene desaturase